MRRILSTLALVACLGSAQSAAAAQVSYNIKGNSCFPTYGTPSYNQWGVYNSNPNDHVRLNCPVELPRHPYVNIQLAVTGWSLSNDINPLSCTVTSTGQDGNNAFSGTINLPYNPNTASSGSRTIGASGLNTYVSISCFIPRAVNANSSYLSSLIVHGFY